MQNLVATPESASLDGPQCLSLQYRPCVRVLICGFQSKSQCNSCQPPSHGGQVAVFQKNSVLSATCNTAFFHSNKWCTLQCMIRSLPISGNLEVWACDAQGQAPEEHILESLLNVLCCFFHRFFQDSCHSMPFMPSMHFRSFRFKSPFLHTMELRWLSQFQGLLEQGKKHPWHHLVVFCKATRHGLRSFMKDKKKVSHFIKLSYLLLKFVEEENLL